MRRLSCEKGKIIFHQGDPFDAYYFLCEGSVKLIKVLKNGEQIILDVLEPFSFINLIPEREGSRHACTAVTVTESAQVAYIKEVRFNTLLRQYPALGFAIARYFSAKLRTIGRLLACMKLPVRERLLAYLAGKMAVDQPERNRCVMHLHVTQRELAEIIQTTPESLSRSIRTLREEGILRISKGAIEVLKPDMLKEFLNDQGS